jgi:two-component system, NarL family, response regulator DegU
MSRINLSIVIADDHPVFRHGLRHIIEGEPGFEVVGEAGDGQSALEMIRTLRPAIAVLDVAMPQLDGLGLARQLLADKSSVEIIFVTMFREERLLTTALEAGVKGYVLKDSAATDIVSCIRAVAAGQHYASQGLMTYLVKRAQPAGDDGTRSGVEGLTPTERRVLALIADYKTSKTIAEELFISPRTVDTHRNNICRKLGITGSHALMKFALGHKGVSS